MELPPILNYWRSNNKSNVLWKTEVIAFYFVLSSLLSY
jgi:hypothetical protein